MCNSHCANLIYFLSKHAIWVIYIVCLITGRNIQVKTWVKIWRHNITAVYVIICKEIMYMYKYVENRA